jgi:hypothetical protein
MKVMKINPPSNLCSTRQFTVILFIISLILSILNASSQSSYSLNHAMQGGMTLRFRENGQSGGFNVSFTNITANVYLNTQSNQVRVVGFVRVSQDQPSISYTVTRSIAQTFPNPPMQVTGTVTVALSLTDGGLSFDTGYKPITFDQSINQYTFEPWVLSSIPVTGRYVVVTGGQTNSGTFAYNLNTALGEAGVFGRLSTANYPARLDLSGMGYTGGMFSYSVGAGVVVDMAASNGFPVKIEPGVPMWGLFSGESFNWNFGHPEGNAGLALWDFTQVPALPGEYSLLPGFLTQPLSIFVDAGSIATFSVTATGVGLLSYQWLKNATVLPGRTNSSLVLTNVQTGDAGGYSVLVTNAFGGITSAVGTLTVGSAQTAIRSSSISFDGINSYAQFANPFFQSQTLTNWSVEMWFKTRNILGGNRGSQMLWGKSGFWKGVWISFQTDGSIGCWYEYPSPQAYWGVVSGVGVVKNLTWHHMAAVMNGTNLQFFVDGTKVAGAVGNGLVNWTQDSGGASTGLNMLGREQDGNFGTNDRFNGMISEFRIWNKALTQIDIQNNMNKQLTPANHPELVGYWTMAQGLGNTVPDMVSSNTLTLYGNAGWTNDAPTMTQDEGTIPADILQGLVAYYPFNGNANDESGNGNNGMASGAILSSDRFGNPDKAYSFDGKSFIKIANSPSLSSPTQSVTLSAWFR